MFDAECLGGSEILMFEGDNPTKSTALGAAATCPASTVIEVKRECEDVAKKLSLSDTVIEDSDTGEWAHLPRGCFMSSANRLTFNTHLTSMFGCSDGAQYCICNPNPVNNDNKGSTYAEKIHLCGTACRDKKKPPKSTDSWTNFHALGFIIDPISGRCFCETVRSDTCSRTNENIYGKFSVLFF
jgi:hypothetical protein